MNDRLNNLLFKYRAFNKSSLEILINKKIYLAKSCTFNDPFDSQLLPKDFQQELVDLGYQLEDVQINEYNDYVKDRLDGYGIFSMSESHDNILMWAHYADSHKGFCLGFKNDLNRYFTEYDYPIWKEDVIYDIDHPFQSVIDDLLKKRKYNSRDDFDNYCKLSDALLNAALTVKHKSWNYEKEVRVISEFNGLQNFESQAIQIVILGLKVTEEDEDTIRSLLASNEWKHVKIYKAIRSKAALKIEIVDG